MKIIAIMNQKGGVGKTTVSVNLASSLAMNKKRVLLIDADLQANTTTALGIKPNELNGEGLDLFSVLTKQVKLDQTIVQRVVSFKAQKGVLDVVPATIALSGFDQLVRALPNKQILLRQILSEYCSYDYILIDCPPSLGLLTINSLVVADELFIPVQPEFFGLQGLSQILDTVKLLQNSLNPNLELGGIICSRYNRRKIHNEVLSCLDDRFGKKLFSTRIHENIALAEAPGHAKTIFEYSPNSVGAYDFNLLCREMLNKEIGYENLKHSQSTRMKQV